MRVKVWEFLDFSEKGEDSPRGGNKIGGKGAVVLGLRRDHTYIYSAFSAPFLVAGGMMINRTTDPVM